MKEVLCVLQLLVDEKWRRPSPNELKKDFLKEKSDTSHKESSYRETNKEKVKNPTIALP